MASRISHHADYADPKDAAMNILLLPSKHLGISDKLLAIGSRYAVGLIIAIDKHLIFAIYKVVVI